MARKPIPREMPPMTDAQRRANWWDYHRRHVLIGVVALALLCAAAWERLSRTAPDCSVALVLRFQPTVEEIAALQTALEAAGPDVNGDGRVSVAINVIQIDYTSTDLDSGALEVMRTNVDKLNADFYTNQSGLFLLDDPASFQASHHALAYRDGSLPGEEAEDWENMTVPWETCMDISFAGLGEGTLWLGRRAAFTEADRMAFAGAEAMWQCLVE